MTQADMIYRHLEMFGSINPVEALSEYGCFRLAARINDLRTKHEIETTMIERTNRFGKKVRFAEYRLAPRCFVCGGKSIGAYCAECSPEDGQMRLF